MIKLDRDTLQLMKVYSKTPRIRDIKLFGVKISFWRKLSREHLYWTTESTMNQMNLAIHHRGRFTWHSIKKTLETSLNYHSSYLRKAIIMGILK